MLVDENNLGIRMWLIENAYQPGRNWDKMADMALQALFIAPLDAKVHSLRAAALRKLKKYDDAAKHYETIRKLATGTPEEIKQAEVNAILDIAAMWMQAGQDEKARKYLAEAKKIDPTNERIKTIESELDGSDAKEEDF
jgi:tetratricopeptide (TPR) repeat protein